MVDETVLDEAEGSFDDPIDLETADFGNEPENAADAASSDVESDAADGEGTDTALAKSSGDSDETDGEAEGDEGTPDAKAVAPKQREPMLPKHRYDSVRRQLREAEAALKAEREAKAEAGEGSEPAPARDFDAEIADLSKGFTEALQDNDTEKATQLNQQMMALQTERVQAMMSESRVDVISASQDAMLTNTLVDELVATHAELNPDAEAFDQQLVSRLNNMRNYFENAEGYTESQALVKTIEVLMPQAFESKASAAAVDEGKKLADKIEKANRQPPNANRVGDDGPDFGQGQELVASKLSLDDLDKVTEAQWDVMLGNNL